MLLICNLKMHIVHNCYMLQQYILYNIMISRKQIGFIASIIVMIVIYAASSAHILLYSDYQSILGIAKATLSLTAVVYFLGTVISLLFFGRVSNYIGRRYFIITSP